MKSYLKRVDGLTSVEYIEEQDTIPEVMEIDHDVTAGSTLWLSWPNDIPWRKFERIRSDESVEIAGEVAGEVVQAGRMGREGAESTAV
jgi:hypothetical protein